MADYVSYYTGAQIDSAIEWVNANRQSATDTDAIFSAGSNSAPDFLGRNSTFDAWIENIINATALGRVRLIQDDNGGVLSLKMAQVFLALELFQTILFMVLFLI